MWLLFIPPHHTCVFTLPCGPRHICWRPSSRLNTSLSFARFKPTVYNGLVYNTRFCPFVCRPSVWRLSVCDECIVAKRYVLPKNCLKWKSGLHDPYVVVPSRRPTIRYSPNGGTDCISKYLLCKLRRNRYSLRHGCYWQ